MYQILQKFDMHWHDGGPSIAMMYHLRRVSDLLCNWKSCLLCYMKDVVLHCSIFFKWNKLVRVRVRVRVLMVIARALSWMKKCEFQENLHWIFNDKNFLVEFSCFDLNHCDLIAPYSIRVHCQHWFSFFCGIKLLLIWFCLNTRRNPDFNTFHAANALGVSHLNMFKITFLKWWFTIPEDQWVNQMSV